MRWTKEQLDEYEARRARGVGDRKRPVKEEQQNADTRSSDNKARVSKVDGKVHPRFRVTIVLWYSDNRRRDADGGATTILDCLIDARRRFVAMDTGNKNPGEQGKPQ